MYGIRQWEISFAGVLANDGEVSTGRNSIIINRNNNLQFYIRLISTPPENFPRQVKDVCCYAEDLDNWGFYDNTSFSDFQRREALQEFLNRYVLFFQVELRKPNGITEFHVAKNIHIVKKSDSFRPDTILEPVPIFSEETTERTKEIFEQQLIKGRYVGDNKQISNNDDDTPSVILWKNSSGQHDFTLYGVFNKHEHANGGFRFNSTTNNIKSVKFQIDYIMESYFNDQVLFMDSKFCEELQTVLVEHGDEVGKNNDILDNEKSETENSTNKTLDVDSDVKEAEFMELFSKECKRLGLYYDEVDLYNFHTAMKTGGLVILAGMSGTGKSKLIQCYANALKLSKDQMLFVPVRPFWQDDADVIGYLDTLHNVYRPGDSGLLNLLTRANNYSDDLHIVCFDEMNLARVEHYFSQFLSILELEENKRFLHLYNDEFSTRIYNQNMFPSTLRIGTNVIFVGTVNLDESTYHFSDKVLDRANVITLTIKPYFDVLKMEEERIHELPLSTNATTRENSFTFDMYKSFKRTEREILLTAEESKLLWELHKEFQFCNRNLGIGWRIIRQISNFLNNIPLVSPLTREEAFDIQLVQRVLTKIRGSEEQFVELLGRYNPELKIVENSKFLELLSTMPYNYQFNRTKELIIEKSRELRIYGHTV